ncbi:lipid kinase YegS [soil metagenome]
MTAPRWRLILHGKCASDEPVREAVAAMRERGIDIDVRVTWESGDAERYVSEAVRDGVDTVVAGGGDGTLSAVAGALARAADDTPRLPSLGLLPLGTANDFAAAAALPEEALPALELIHAHPAQAIDLLCVDSDGASHWALNLASAGFGTEVTLETREGLKDVLGGLAYLLTGLSRIGGIEPIAARVHGPDFDWQGGFIALGIGNGRQAGGGQALCPEALIDDGLLDLTIVPELEGELATTLATALGEGRQAALERIATTARLPWVEVEAVQPFNLNLDGEPVQSARFHIACVAGRLRMHLPPGCPLLGVPGNPIASDAPADPTGDVPGDAPDLVPA